MLGTSLAHRRTGVIAVSALLLAALTGVVGPTESAKAAPKAPVFTADQGIEPLSDYEPQTTCDPVAKPGVVAFRSMVLNAYPGSGDDGIVRACNIGGTSEHKEGRAWDWQVSVSNPTQAAQAHDLISWLLATDSFGNKYAMARRLGVMYIIWDKQIWGAYRASDGWRCYYACPGSPSSYNNDPHTGHVHISFNWNGAMGHTTFYGLKLTPEQMHQWQTAGSTLAPVLTMSPGAGVSVVAPPDKEWDVDLGSVTSSERFARH